VATRQASVKFYFENDQGQWEQMKQAGMVKALTNAWDADACNVSFAPLKFDFVDFTQTNEITNNKRAIKVVDRDGKLHHSVMLVDRDGKLYHSRPQKPQPTPTPVPAAAPAAVVAPTYQAKYIKPIVGQDQDILMFHYPGTPGQYYPGKPSAPAPVDQRCNAGWMSNFYDRDVDITVNGITYANNEAYWHSLKEPNMSHKWYWSRTSYGQGLGNIRTGDDAFQQKRAREGLWKQRNTQWIRNDVWHMLVGVMEKVKSCKSWMVNELMSLDENRMMFVEHSLINEREKRWSDGVLGDGQNALGAVWYVATLMVKEDPTLRKWDACYAAAGQVPTTSMSEAHWNAVESNFPNTVDHLARKGFGDLGVKTGNKDLAPAWLDATRRANAVRQAQRIA